MITLDAGLFLGLLGLATWSIFCNIDESEYILTEESEVK